MSKLVQAIRHTNLQIQKANCMPLATITRDIDETVIKGYDLLTKYRIQVSIGAEAYIKNNAELPIAIESTARSIVEEVFGEFRSYFREIERALWERDFDEAKMLLKQMEELMFKY